MSKELTITDLAESPDLRAGQRYAMQGIAAEYLARLGILGEVLESRSPIEQISEHESLMDAADPLMAGVVKTRLQYVAGGFEDPGHAGVLAEIQQEEETKAALRRQTEV